MKTRIRRRVRRPPDLTSLFDVLFIVVFVALIRAAAAQQAADAAAQPPPRPVEPLQPPPPANVAVLKARALTAIQADLAKRTPLVIRVSERGVVTMLESVPPAGYGDGKRVLDVPLLEVSADPNVATTYLGDRSADLRVCRVAALHLGVPDLARYMVIVAPAMPRARRVVALNEGLDRDVSRCMTEQRGHATIVDPEPVTPPPP